MNTAEKIRKELDGLIAEAILLFASLSDEQRKELEKTLGKAIEKLDFKSKYQQWYTKASAAVRDLLPSRLTDFQAFYQLPKRRSIDLETYAIADYLAGYSLVGHSSVSVVQAKFYQQYQIVEACRAKLDSALLNVRQLLHADLLDGEIGEARELLKRGFLRAAGAVAGVALEKHLAMVVGTHGIALKKKDPTIGDLNEALKAVDVYDTPTWRLVSRLGDLRNLCDHNRKREPTTDEVNELIDGVDKIAKSVH